MTHATPLLPHRPPAIPVQMDREALWPADPDLAAPNLHQPYLVRAALIVSHAAALGALEGCRFGGDGQSEWGDPAAFSTHLMDVYDTPQATAALGLLRRVWAEVAAQSATPGIGPEGPWERWQTLVDATSFSVGHTVHFRPDAEATTSPERVILDGVFTRLIQVAHDWLADQRQSDGVRVWPAGNVARSAAFAYLHLSALADAQPGQPLHVRGEGEVDALAWTLACALADHPDFTRLDDRERQTTSELLLLMPLFLAAAYGYGHLSADEGAQALAVEVACEELDSFFGVQRLRGDLHTLSSLHLGEL